MEHVLCFVFAAGPEEVLYGYGPLGVSVVVLAVALYKLFNVLMNDRDKAIQQRDDLLEDFFTKVLPAITKNTEVLQARQDLDREIIIILNDSTTAVKENTKVMKDLKNDLKIRGGNSQTGGTRRAPLE